MVNCSDDMALLPVRAEAARASGPLGSKMHPGDKES